MSTEVKKGKGRPKGATNRISRELKESINEILNLKVSNSFEFNRLWNELKPSEQAKLIVELLKYALPQPQPVSDDTTKQIASIYDVITKQAANDTSIPVNQ
jgi:hypothetical protein